MAHPPLLVLEPATQDSESCFKTKGMVNHSYKHTHAYILSDGLINTEFLGIVCLGF
jgi:hypothetical protein